MITDAARELLRKIRWVGVMPCHSLEYQTIPRKTLTAVFEEKLITFARVEGDTVVHLTDAGRAELG